VITCIILEMEGKVECQCQYTLLEEGKIRGRIPDNEVPEANRLFFMADAGRKVSPSPKGKVIETRWAQQNGEEQGALRTDQSQDRQHFLCT